MLLGALVLKVFSMIDELEHEFDFAVWLLGSSTVYLDVDFMNDYMHRLGKFRSIQAHGRYGKSNCASLGL